MARILLVSRDDYDPNKGFFPLPLSTVQCQAQAAFPLRRTLEIVTSDPIL